MSYLHNFSTRETPQSEPIPDSNQVQNSAGGFSWQVTDMTRLERFLILGSEGGSYYVSEQKLTKNNANVIIQALKNHPEETIDKIVYVSDRGLAPKNDPALFALAIATASANVETRKKAFRALPHVARTGTHIMHFAQFMQQFRGWGRGAKNAVGHWFLDKSAKELAYQAIKYQSRDGWALSDLLRLSHPVPDGGLEMAVVFNWICNGWESVGDLPHPNEALQQIWAFERAKRATTEKEIINLIMGYHLPREAIPTQWLTYPYVWSALLERMPLEAMIRNLATMTKVGLLKPISIDVATVVNRLHDLDRIKKSRLHPIKLLASLTTYQQGHGMRSDATWNPITQIVDALNDAFYLAFDNIVPTNKRYCLALDVSGSMSMGSMSGIPGLTPRNASAAMALVTANVEKNHYMMGFGHQFMPINISPRQRLDDAIRQISNLPFGGTDCSIPILWALDNNIAVDCFVVYTDSETWSGNIHPSQALMKYRQKTGINAKLAVVGMVSNGFSIADPNDAGMLDVVGFSTETPQVMNWFFS